MNSRRKLLLEMTSMSLGLPLNHFGVLRFLADSTTGPQSPRADAGPAAPPVPGALSPQDDQFLEELEHANFLFFWEQSDPLTGLIKGPLQCSRERH